MIRGNRYQPSEPALIDRCKIVVRFSEVDSMHIVWHGEYVRYFEDGRESFGRKYGIDYLCIQKNGYTAPIVDLSCQFKASLRYGEEAIVETRYISTDAAKIVFEYIVYKSDLKTIAATGHSVQIFLNNADEMELVNPQFYAEWKERWKIV